MRFSPCPCIVAIYPERLIFLGGAKESTAVVAELSAILAGFDESPANKVSSHRELLRCRLAGSFAALTLQNLIPRPHLSPLSITGHAPRSSA